MVVERETTKVGGADDSIREHGTYHIRQSIIRNSIKHTIEHNHLGVATASSFVKGGLEANVTKLSAEANGTKLGIEINGGKLSGELYLMKSSQEIGAHRFSNTIVRKTSSASVFSDSVSHSTNKISERSFSQHLGRRFTATVPPYLDVAIIDATPPVGGAANESRNGAAGWDVHRYRPNTPELDGLREEPLSTKALNPDSSNFIFLTPGDIEEDVREYLKTLPEWEKFEETIFNPIRFRHMLRTLASPWFPGNKRHFPPFQGQGISVEKARSLGATCRLQVSHGANQTIQIFSNSLRTIRFNAVSTIDNGQNNQIYLGGKYEHIKIRSTKLVEGPFVQHHRRGLTNGVAKFRFEDDTSFSYVIPEGGDGIRNLWSIAFRESGVYIGNIADWGDHTDEDYVAPNQLNMPIGLAINEDSVRAGSATVGLDINPEKGCITLGAGNNRLIFNERVFDVGDLLVRVG